MAIFQCVMLALMIQLSGTSCSTLAPAPPANLTPQVTAAWYATYAIKDLDVIRDFANDASNTTPPVISKPVMLKVVDWHESLVKVIHASPAGWKAAASAGLTELQDTILSPVDAAKFKAVIDAARTYLQEAP
jgi:hypothetical protein